MIRYPRLSNISVLQGNPGFDSNWTWAIFHIAKFDFSTFQQLKYGYWCPCVVGIWCVDLDALILQQYMLNYHTNKGMDTIHNNWCMRKNIWSTLKMSFMGGLLLENGTKCGYVYICFSTIDRQRFMNWWYHTVAFSEVMFIKRSAHHQCRIIHIDLMLHTTMQCWRKELYIYAAHYVNTGVRWLIVYSEICIH